VAGIEIMRIELGSRLEEIANVMAALEEFSDSTGLDMGVAQAAELVLDELLTNIISYSFGDAVEHKITVEMSVKANALHIVISDDGICFNPFEQEDPDLESSIDERDVGGLGIHLVKKFMDEYSYQRLKGRNVVTLLKHIG
jgi:sigma-B regulation protein RsbU (phosphoserine phosphatase)